MGAPPGSAVATWSDADLSAAVAAGTFRCEPWHPGDLTPNGLDLRIGHVLVPGVMASPQTEGTVQVPAMSRFVIGTQGVLTMPVDAVASLWLRSSWARKGVLASFGKVDAGFAGNLTLGAFNAGADPLDVPVGERFCQLVLETLQSPPTKTYAQQGRYQNQRGVTLAK